MFGFGGRSTGNETIYELRQPEPEETQSKERFTTSRETKLAETVLALVKDAQLETDTAPGDILSITLPDDVASTNAVELRTEIAVLDTGIHSPLVLGTTITDDGKVVAHVQLV